MSNSLSVVIVNFNTGSYLADCVRSIKRTTKDFATPSTEVIIVDNASTDDSAGKLKTQNSKRKTTTENLKLILNKKNVGFARAVNQGIQAAHGEYVLLLNPDTRVKIGAIQKLFEFAQKHRKAGVIGARLLNSDGSIQKSAMPFPTLWRAIQEFWFGKKGVYSKYAPDTREPAIVEAVVGAAFLITPQAREKVEMMDERFWMYFEDLDYCRRVKKAGLKVYYLPTAEIVHYHGVSGRDVVDKDGQWRRLVPSSKVYHGLIGHYVINFVLWSGQKIKSLL